ncbi:MAG: EAL domain-containing protein [Alphaproteobacteria bacterium]|nr:MAG: EAL domain-containing protein [Alphaproteobacteria bacterium]
MGLMTQILLFVSYAILGVALIIIPPRMFGLSEQTSGFLGLFVFFGAWQLQNWLQNRRNEETAKTRLEKLEDTAIILRGDLERTRRDVSSKSRTTDEKSDKLVSELKVLHTLLGQVMNKEVELQKIAKQKSPPAAPEDAAKPAAPQEGTAPTEAPAPKTAGKAAVPPVGAKAAAAKVAEAPAPQAEAAPAEEQLTQEEIEELELTPEEAALAAVDIEEEVANADGPDEMVVASESGTPVAPEVARRTKGRKKAAIRLIKREDQLLSVIRSSLSENRVDLYLQPIVSLPARRPVHYECFSRVRDEDGRIILPRQYMKVAEAKGLIGTIDNLLLFRLIQLVRRLGRRRPDVRFFCNMSRFSINDQEFFPQFIDFMTSNEEFAGRLVFEISQEDYYALEGDVTERLQTLGRKGFGFSMDMVKDFNRDFVGLGRQHFQFVKPDLKDLLLTHPEMGDVDDFKALLRRNGMQLITSRIESEEMVLQALESQVELAQGYLFGEPMSAADLNREL